MKVTRPEKPEEKPAAPAAVLAVDDNALRWGSSGAPGRCAVNASLSINRPICLRVNLVHCHRHVSVAGKCSTPAPALVCLDQGETPKNGGAEKEIHSLVEVNQAIKA